MLLRHFLLDHSHCQFIITIPLNQATQRWSCKNNERSGLEEFHQLNFVNESSDQRNEMLWTSEKRQQNMNLSLGTETRIFWSADKFDKRMKEWIEDDLYLHHDKLNSRVCGSFSFESSWLMH
jgi:hypothetical protein